MKYLAATISLIILIIGLPIGGCITQNQPTSDLPSNKYVAIFEMISENPNVTMIEGRVPTVMEPPRPPVFDYDGSEGLLRNEITINDSLKMVYGTFYFTFSYERRRGEMDVRGIYSLPYKVDDNLTILGVDHNGTVQMSYQKQIINLTIGDRWVSPLISSWTENKNGTMKFGVYENGTIKETSEPYNYTTRYDTTMYVENKGIFDKSNIK
ncbi:hypothetical protein [Methanocella sp. MCL-LM]|uniref:hypothetical protein n=1 Tax=Methanocella sp. MCL-LM TaxID=3412035 RepID=UPI003C76E941